MSARLRSLVAEYADGSQRVHEMPDHVQMSWLGVKYGLILPPKAGDDSIERHFADFDLCDPSCWRELPAPEPKPEVCARCGRPGRAYHCILGAPDAK